MIRSFVAAVTITVSLVLAAPAQAAPQPGTPTPTAPHPRVFHAATAPRIGTAWAVPRSAVNA